MNSWKKRLLALLLRQVYLIWGTLVVVVVSGLTGAIIPAIIGCSAGIGMALLLISVK